MKKILKKIFNHLTKPHKIPFKILNKINYLVKLKNYNQNLFEKEQNDIFSSWGLDRYEGIKNLHKIKLNTPLIAKNREMSSEHEIIFSSISIKKKKEIIDILEIGTFDGFNAFLLSNLFPDSKIDTIDLPTTDKDFRDFYNRKNDFKEFVSSRNQLLSKKININFIPINSLNLLNYKKKYDLIWVDGAHGYPVACIDIINSLNIVNNDGLILCDDIYLNYDSSDKMYNSIATYETLNALKKENLIDFKLFYKRLTPKSNCLENQRKYIAMVKKVN